MQKISRNTMIRDLDIRYLPGSRRRIFSIKFVTIDGRLKFIPMAYACGAGKMNMKANRMRGICPGDAQGNAEDHVYPVRIDNIIWYNGMPVVFTKENTQTN